MPTLTDLIPAPVAAKLDELARRYDEASHALEDPTVTADFKRVRELSIKRAAIEPVVSDYLALRAALAEADDLQQVIDAGDDKELAAMAREELPALRHKAQALARAALEKLVSADDQAIGSVVLELRAGVGGDEAALWTAELLDMYRRLADKRGWTFELMDLSEGGGGAASGGAGVKGAVATIAGPGVWTEMAHEAGTHCVKRVPATEAQGRIHTSTATAAVLPEPEEIDLKVDPADVMEDITTAQGPGGQNVNKVATAVHLIHRPTGVEVRMQESKSQRQNREKAWRLLRARLYELELQKQRAERDKARNTQIGSADRSERIRTYRFKEGMAVDHRLNQDFNLSGVLAAGDAMDDMLRALHEQETARRLAAM